LSALLLIVPVFWGQSCNTGTISALPLIVPVLQL